jgi:ABC-type phosphate transport system auxiliary subunit
MYAQSVPFVLIFLTILAGILLNNKGLSDLKAELKADNADLKAELKADNAELKAELKADISRIDARLNSMQSDLNQFYVVMGKLEGRLDAIEKRAA